MKNGCNNINATINKNHNKNISSIYLRLYNNNHYKNTTTLTPSYSTSDNTRIAQGISSTINALTPVSYASNNSHVVLGVYVTGIFCISKICCVRSLVNLSIGVIKYSYLSHGERNCKSCGSKVSRPTRISLCVPNQSLARSLYVINTTLSDNSAFLTD